MKELATAFAAALLLVASHFAAYLYGESAGDDHRTAVVAREQRVAEVATAAAASAAATAISHIEVQHVTIRQPLEREVRENTVYRDCRVTPDGMRLLNAAITGAEPAAAAGGVPSASAPGR